MEEKVEEYIITAWTQVCWLAAGAAIGVIVTLAILGLRKAYVRRQIKMIFSSPPLLKKQSPQHSSSTSIHKESNTGRRKNDQGDSRDAKSVNDEREAKLAEMIKEMRELIIRLTEIVASTDNASGEASRSFEEARSALGAMDMESDVSIRQVKVLLLNEIDRMVKSNEALKQQLVNAQSGMATQQKEIDKLRTVVHIDTLTQLPNRSAFDERLREAVEHFKKTKEVFSLFMLDVDHFKNINDTHGHLHGDRILREIGTKIRECVRDTDFPARYGGEEFAIIFPDTPSEEALTLGDRVRTHVERSHFQVDTRPIKITISGGIALCAERWCPEDVIDVADKALYRSKTRGRNRITLGADRLKEYWTSGEGTDPHADLQVEL